MRLCARLTIDNLVKHMWPTRMTNIWPIRIQILRWRHCSIIEWHGSNFIVIPLHVEYFEMVDFISNTAITVLSNQNIREMSRVIEKKYEETHIHEIHFPREHRSRSLHWMRFEQVWIRKMRVSNKEEIFWDDLKETFTLFEFQFGVLMTGHSKEHKKSFTYLRIKQTFLLLRPLKYSFFKAFESKFSLLNKPPFPLGNKEISIILEHLWNYLKDKVV